MNYYKHAISLVLAMILVVVSLSLVSAAETQMSTDLQTINDNNVELSSNNSTINQHLSGNNKINSSLNNVANIYSCNISCEKDFQQLSKYLKSSNQTYDCIYVNITKDINITSSNAWSENSKSLFIINGNHHTIKVSNPSDRGENHFLTVGENGKVVIRNLTLSRFNSAIVNHGNVEVERVIFNSNRKNYRLEQTDVGGAVWNRGVLNCINCSFIKNYANLGGAIFSNSSGSIVNLINCYFSDNEAYADSNGWRSFCSGFWNHITKVNDFLNRNKRECYVCSGDDVFVGCGGTVYAYSLNPPRLLHGSDEFFCTPKNKIIFGYDDSNLGHTIVLRDSYEPIIREYIINNVTNLKKVVDDIRGAGTGVDKFVINFTDNVNFDPWTKSLVLFKPQYGSILINGNGYNVNLRGASERDEYHFTTLNINSNMVANNLGISGFNCAIVNNGHACFNNVTFSNNKIKYRLESGDDCGVINNYGMVVCNNCTFINNFGLWAGAIYGAHGALTYLINCTYDKNSHSKDDGGDLYSYNKAQFYLNGVEVNSSNIKYANISIGYGQLPSGVTKVIYQGLDFFTPLISFVAGFVTGVCSVNPAVGIGVGAAVGTVLGVSCNVGYRLYYAGLTHEFSYNILLHIPLDIIIHFGAAISGAKMGADVSQKIHKNPGEVAQQVPIKSGENMKNIKLDNLDSDLKKLNIPKTDNVGGNVHELDIQVIYPNGDEFGMYHIDSLNLAKFQEICTPVAKMRLIDHRICVNNGWSYLFVN